MIIPIYQLTLPEWMSSRITDLSEKTTEILRRVHEDFGSSVVFLTSLGAEDMVITSILDNARIPVRHVTIDTGRLPSETYEVMDLLRTRYKIALEVKFPERVAVEDMVREKGVNLFYESRENRELCCGVRKVEPLNRILKDVRAWITGIRGDQTKVRAEASHVEIDNAHGGITKVNPLLDWKAEEIWEYISENMVPYNRLYDRGYRSIGCFPCTRAVNPGESERSGRWWWETGIKECGLHMNTGKIQIEVREA